MARLFEDQGYFRRKFPRRQLNRRVGVLVRGVYFTCLAGELGEGGMSIETDMVLKDETLLVISFQIPGGSFVSLRCRVKSSIKKTSQILYGLAYEKITFSNKREIRDFVSERNDLGLLRR